jgi:hypothetical protein
LWAEEVPAPPPEPQAKSAQPAADQAQVVTLPSTWLNSQLPKWVRLDFDHRFRFENYKSLRDNKGNDDHWFLNRFRATMNVIPTRWLSFTLQGQDARIFFKHNPAGSAPFTNRVDLRMAFVDVGNINKGKFALRVGRQELAYGEDRLVGAANWGNVARTFDAVRFVTRQGPLQLDLFSASVVVPALTGFSEFRSGNNLHGAYLKASNWVKGASVEPYFLWRVGPGRGDVPGGIGHQDRRVSGVRFIGKLPENFDYSTETVLQSGTVGASSISAFATHLVARHTWAGVRWTPRWFAEYNYASGDKTPGDGKSSTFDQLYPTPHDKTGLSDQVGWQNISDLATGADFSPVRGLTFKAAVHDWRLAQARDGVYLTNGTLIFRDPSGQSGKHVGWETDITGIYQRGVHYIGFGYAHLIPGHFLTRLSQGAHLNYFYINVGYHF